MPTDPQTLIVRRGLERACKVFAERIAPSGFVRTKKMDWTRPREHTVDVVHFHREGSSYGAPSGARVAIRVHCTLRVLNDDLPALALVGPSSEVAITKKGGYHLSFNAESFDAFDRCLDDLVRFVETEGEPWFERFAVPASLLERPDSPLPEPTRARLRAALAGEADPHHVAQSRKLLGIKDEDPG